jgi:hypothetical protein
MFGMGSRLAPSAGYPAARAEVARSCGAERRGEGAVTSGSGNAARLLSDEAVHPGKLDRFDADELGVVGLSRLLRSGTILPPGKSPDDARIAERDDLTGFLTERAAMAAVAVVNRLSVACRRSVSAHTRIEPREV